MSDNIWRVRKVPRAIQVRFKHAAELAGMKIGPALVEAMSDWIKKQNGKGIK